MLQLDDVTVDCSLLQPAQIKDMKIKLAVSSPDDVALDAHGLAAELAKSAVESGAVKHYSLCRRLRCHAFRSYTRDAA